MLFDVGRVGSGLTVAQPKKSADTWSINHFSRLYSLILQKSKLETPKKQQFKVCFDICIRPRLLYEQQQNKPHFQQWSINHFSQLLFSDSPKVQTQNNHKNSNSRPVLTRTTSNQTSTTTMATKYQQKAKENLQSNALPLSYKHAASLLLTSLSAQRESNT